MHICNICLDTMDLKEYNDSRDSTETSFKLGCGHAFHTKCIIEFLNRTEHKCPACNKYKDPVIRLDTEGLASNLCSEFLRTKEMREAKKETEEALKNYKNTLKKLKSEVFKYSEKLVEEYKIKEQKKYLINCYNNTKKICFELAKEKGNRYLGSFLFKRQFYQLSVGERMCLPKNLTKTWWSYNRIMKPRINFQIFKKEK